MPNRELLTLRLNLLTQGAEKLSDAELLGLVLGSGNLARSLAHKSGRWWSLGPNDLRKIPRCGPSRVAQILSLVELAARIRSQPLVQGETLTCSERVASLYGPRLARRMQEIFLVLALDTKNRVIAEHEIARGTMNSVQVDPRLVFRKLLTDGAAALIALHNHPSGDPAPSGDDIQMCERLVECGRMLSLKVVDFVIVGAGSATSFADTGLLGGGAS